MPSKRYPHPEERSAGARLEGRMVILQLGSTLALALTAAGLMLETLAASAADMPEMTPEPTAVIQGLDKITARVSRFDATVGQPATFGLLSIVVRDCEKSAPEERPENAAFIEIYENRPGEDKARLFG